MAENTLKPTDKHKHTTTPTNPDTTNRGNTHPKTTSSLTTTSSQPQKTQQPTHPAIYNARTPNKN